LTDRARHGHEDTNLRETLEQLGLDYVDLFLVHWPQRRADGKFDHVETWKAMEKLVRADHGARFIGISNHSPKQVKEVVEAATIRPKVHQFESHPYLQQTEAVKQSMGYGITVTGYAPLANTNPVHNLGVAAGSEGNRAPPVLANAAIREVAKARGCSLAQVVLAWNVKRGTAVIPKASQIAHQKENIVTLQKCKITDEDAAKIADIRKTVEVRLYENVCRFGNTDGCSKKALEGRRPGRR
jgi:diketogulonate reductase-like aldo/keto reductase